MTQENKPRSFVKRLDPETPPTIDEFLIAAGVLKHADEKNEIVFADEIKIQNTKEARALLAMAKQYAECCLLDDSGWANVKDYRKILESDEHDQDTGLSKLGVDLDLIRAVIAGHSKETVGKKANSRPKSLDEFLISTGILARLDENSSPVFVPAIEAHIPDQKFRYELYTTLWQHATDAILYEANLIAISDLDKSASDASIPLHGLDETALDVSELKNKISLSAKRLVRQPSGPSL